MSSHIASVFMKKRLIIIYVITLLTIIFSLHIKSLNSYFVGDDLDQIVALHDKKISFLLTFFFTDFYSLPSEWHTQMEKYGMGKDRGAIRAFVIISHKLEYILYGTDPTGYHLTNILLHFLNSLLIFFIVNKITSNSNKALGFMAGIFFAVNPMLYMSVSWISGRGDILSAFFYLMAFYLFILYRLDNLKKHYFFSILSFLLGLFTKESAIVLPMQIIFYDFTGKLKNLEFFKQSIRIEAIKIFRKNLMIWMPYLVISFLYLCLRKILFGSFIAGHGAAIHLNVNILSKIGNLIIYMRDSLFAVAFNGYFERLSREKAYQTILLLIVFFIPPFLIGLRYRNIIWSLFNLGVLFFVIPYIPILFYPVAAPWIFYLPVFGISCVITALIFSLPWKRLRLAAAVSLIMFYAIHQFQYNSNFNVAGSWTKQITEDVEKAAENFHEGDMVVLIDMPEYYKTAWAFPMDSALRSALRRPFAHSDLVNHFDVKRARLSDQVYTHAMLDDIIRDNYKCKKNIHLLIWEEKTHKLEELKEIPFYIKALDKAVIEVTPPGNIWKNITFSRFDINNDKRITLYEHPPAKITYKLKIPKGGFLSFGIALHPLAWSPDKGDGVLFKISAKDGEEERELFSKYIDPKNKEADRKWHDEKVDLSKYGGKEILLTFITLPGPSSNVAYDYAAWGNLNLISR